ncbi:MAG: restriction endonuclease subunit S [Paludibacteraceae bacterium]|nr:restriction endonuclease subunit S [Paludibacteraceae bacterium]
MEKYSSYKDSGVKWLGEIPSHWEVVSIKKISNIILGKMLENAPDDQGFPYLCAKDVHFDGVSYDDLKKMLFSENEKKKYIVKKGDLLVVEGGAGGTCAIIDKDIDDVYIQNSLMIVRGFPNKVSNNYIFYALSSLVKRGYADSVCNKATILHFTKEKLESTNIALAPLCEQIKIINYLDTVTTKIDVAIEQQKKMIELLNERKQIIINNAVTKGLDPNVKMKDSGVDWIGEIPEGWKIKRGKYLFKIINEYSVTGEEELLTVSDRTGVTPRSMKNVNMFMAESLVGYKKCQVGDICSNIMWMWHGAVGVTKYNGVISPSYGVYRQKEKTYFDEYLDMILRLPRLVKYYASRSTGLTESRLRLYPDDFMNIFFFIPPLEEQKQIVNKLNSICEPIDYAIKSTDHQITLLQERKQIIINEVVMGKVKVS